MDGLSLGALLFFCAMVLLSWVVLSEAHRRGR